jgi:hypothetical protein
MIARLPEMHKQLRELIALVGHQTPASPQKPGVETSSEDDPTGF